MSSYNRPKQSAYTALAAADADPTKISPASRSAGSPGLRGNNPSSDYLLVRIVGPGETAPTKAEMLAGRWNYKVPAYGSWEDGTRDSDAYGLLVSGSATVLCEEVI